MVTSDDDEVVVKRRRRRRRRRGLQETTIDGASGSNGITCDRCTAAALKSPESIRFVSEVSRFVSIFQKATAIIDH